MADGDIITGVDEVRADITNWKLSKVYFDVDNRKCRIVYAKRDASNNIVDHNTTLFINQADDPETPEDETVTEFTQLVTKINNENDIQESIKSAVKFKLGI